MSPHALLTLRKKQLSELEANAKAGCPSAAKALPELRAQVKALAASEK